MALCPKLFLVVCPNCVPNVMLLSSNPQSFHISAALASLLANQPVASESERNQMISGNALP